MRLSAVRFSDGIAAAVPPPATARSGARALRNLGAGLAVAMAMAVSPAGAAAATHGLFVSPTGAAGQADVNCATAGFSSIQSAVNIASSGRTVHVCPGTYDEQVTVSTANLIVKGFGTSTVIDPTTSPTTVTSLSSSATMVPIIDVTPGTTGVKISNLVVDGSGLTPSFTGCSENFVGVLFQAASGSLSYSTVKNIDLGPSLGGCQEGLAVYVQSGPSGTASVGMNYVRASNYDKNGVTCAGAGTTCTLRHLVLTGAGPSSSVGAQNGIQIGPGASGSVGSSNVSGHDWTGEVNSTEPQADYAAGILLYGAGGTTTLTGNRLTDNQVGLEVVDSNADMESTSIRQTGSGISGGIGVFDVPCDFYCSFLSLSPGATTLTVGSTRIAYANRPSGSYGFWLGDSWSGNDPWGSDGSVTYTVQGDLTITGAAHPFVHGSRAVAG